MPSNDPYRAYNFKLDIQGVVYGHFSACSGLNFKVPSIAYREGGAGGAIRKLPGRPEYGDLTLHYGLSDSIELWEWATSAVQGRVQRRNVSVLLLDADGVTEVVRWNLHAAWVTAWNGAKLDSLANEVAIERVTLTFESLERA